MATAIALVKLAAMSPGLLAAGEVSRKRRERAQATRNWSMDG